MKGCKSKYIKKEYSNRCHEIIHNNIRYSFPSSVTGNIPHQYYRITLITPEFETFIMLLGLDAADC